MFLSLKEIIGDFEKAIPLSYQEKWDKSGLQAGRRSQKIKTVLFALDVCNEVLNHAIKSKADLIVTHHPLSVGPLGSYEKKLAKKARSEKIAIYSVHTNYDASFLNLSRYYAEKLRVKIIGPIRPSPKGPFRVGHIKSKRLKDRSKKLKNKKLENVGLGVWGRLVRPKSARGLVGPVKKVFKVKKVRFIGEKNRKIRSIGICTGSGMSLLDDVIKQKIDLFITGDVKYHAAIEAKRGNVCLIDIGHFHSEVESAVALKEIFRKLFGFKLKLVEYKRLKDPFILY